MMYVVWSLGETMLHNWWQLVKLMELEVKTLRRELCAWASNPPKALSAQRVAKHNKIVTQLILKNILHLIKKNYVRK